MTNNSAQLKNGFYTVGKITFKTGTLKANYKYQIKLDEMKSSGFCGEFTIRSLNDDATLKSLEIPDVVFDFDSNTFTYNISANKEIVNINAKTNDANATVKNTGAKQLVYGPNKIELIVTAEDGTTKKYTLNITRTDERSSNNKLKSLTISSGSMEFNTNSSNYSLTVDSSVTMFNLEGYVEDETATFVTGFGPRTVNLVDGNNEILIKVKAENGDVKIYKINVYRKEKEETQTLTDIVLDDEETISVKEDVYQYKVVVDYNKKSLKIKTKHKGSPKIEINGPDTLEVGSNYFQIKVNSKETYNIEVIRNCMDCAVLDTNNYLEDMSVEGHDFDFSRMSTSYSIPYNNQDSLNITAMSENKDAYVQIIGNNNLQPGSVVTILVTAEDGTTKEYQIKILGEDELNKDKENTYGIGTIILVSTLTTIIINGLMILGGYIFFKTKMKKKNKKTKKEKDEKESKDTKEAK